MSSGYRASKSGIAADIEKKQEQKWDDLEEEGVPQAVTDWINALLDDPNDVCEDAGWQTIHRFLKDGSRLCRVANVLSASEGEPGMKFSSNQSAFFCMDNIGKFLKVAEKYGVKRNDLFQSNDLYEGLKGPTVNVITCLHALGLVAKNKRFEPEYTGRGAIALENPRGFTDEEIRAQSAGIIGKQAAASHGLASQSGMRAPGTGRHIAEGK
ncbi:transgelin-3-like [Sycon ciliatum]|uniref:transgelin-3-like n=1 Tax=Sycon ciliatum TaxID=27933 RepID=UPI0031F6D4FF|eukprot:scpid65873/ scgid34677/ Transgelin-3; Neuronal protein 22; Neuronal protein NP25 &gt; Transgelin-3